jgi:hypothetical protein
LTSQDGDWRGMDDAFQSQIAALELSILSWRLLAPEDFGLIACHQLSPC